MMNNLLKTATRPNAFASKINRFGGAVSQRSLHTPIGSTKQKDEAFQVSLSSRNLVCVASKTDVRKI